ncbi:membrane associated progesterone receptor [Trichuris trichiura]|uniref:Membrane associated progesterone receptor n=1 Tax=Trichuris trichiura TaxID=36087 RepID=A0A077ZKP3_TRITR|nr:membrane associated progesterone receptor [Trichuris trichiura]
MLYNFGFPSGWMHWVVCIFAVFLIYKLANVLRKFFWHKADGESSQLPPLKRHDMDLDELRNYDGSNERICLAVNGKIYDVTSKRELYGSGGPYGLFAGRDASRCLAKFSTDVSLLKDDYDDLSDLTSSEMNVLMEWALQFEQLYPCVGRLLGPKDEPDVYTEDEESLSSSNEVDYNVK